MLASRWLWVACVGLSMTLTLQSGDVPTWRGSDRNDINETEKNLLKEWPKDGPKLLWTFKDAGVGYGSPAVVGDKVFLAGSEDPEKGAKEFLTCLNAKDGKQLWRTELGTADGKYSTGWGSGPRSTPTVDGDRVYALGAKGDLLCINSADGVKVWGINLVGDLGGKIPVWGYSESPTIDGDRLLVIPGGKNGAIACLNKADGKVIWQSKEVTDDAGYSSIVVADMAGIKMYITQTMNRALGLDKEGKLLWDSKTLKYRTAVIPTPVYADGYVFVTSGYGAGCECLKLTAKDGKVTAESVYSNKLMVNHHGGVIQVGDYIYGFSDGKNWICMEFKKPAEEPVWKSKALDKGSITCADGMFYCYGQGKGECVLIEASPKDWMEHGRFEIPEKSKFPRRSGQIWTHPVVANGVLYLRDHELVFAYDVSGK